MLGLGEASKRQILLSLNDFLEYDTHKCTILKVPSVEEIIFSFKQLRKESCSNIITHVESNLIKRSHMFENVPFSTRTYSRRAYSPPNLYHDVREAKKHGI